MKYFLAELSKILRSPLTLKKDILSLLQMERFDGTTILGIHSEDIARIYIKSIMKFHWPTMMKVKHESQT